MRILQISSIFPIKDAPDDNPYVRNFIRNYRQKYDAEFAVVKPESHLPWFLGKLSKKPAYWLGKKKICQQGFYPEQDMPVYVLPYYSVGSVSLMHTFFSLFVYKFNKRRLRELVEKEFDIVHAHYLFPDGLIAYQISKKLNKPFVLTLRQEIRFFDNWYSRKWVKKIINQASVLTTQSPQMAEAVKKYNIHNVKTLPTGIEPYFVKQNKKSIAAKKSDKLRLLSVCNLLPVKNLDNVLKAIAEIKDREKIEYTIIGTGPMYDKLIQLTKILNLEKIVQFKGAVDNDQLPAIMPEYDVFIQPSFKETFGLSYFEALACGLPVIITKNTGAYEMIKDKDVFYLVDPLEPGTIRSCIAEIMNDRKTLARKAALTHKVAKIASWDKFVDFFHGKYEEVTKTI